MKLLNKGIYILSLLLLSIPFACTEEEDFSIIAGLDFTVATLNADGNQTGVVPTTVPGDGRIVYTVDFGDPAVSDGADVFMTSGPMVTYSYPKETATYTINVTAAIDGKEDVSITKEHTIVFVVKDPATAGSGLEGTWKLAPEAGALGVGENQNNVGWWSNSSADVATRACLFDDKYVFNADGTFDNVLGADTWLESWQGTDPESCGVPVYPHDSSIDATYTYDAAAGTITLDGKGAFLGLAKVTNTTELSSPGDAPDSVTYLAELSADGNTLEIDIDFGGGWWSFKLVKEAPPAIEGTWKLAPEAGALGVGENQNNVGWWSNSSADVATRACLFDDKYVFNADGTFDNVLGADTWLESWQGTDPESCGVPVYPHDSSIDATYTYDAAAGTITLDGKGAFLGLAKVTNTTELSSPGAAPDSVTYLAELSADGNTLEIDIDFGGGWWSFKLVREVPPTGIQGTWQLAPEAGALGVGENQDNVGWWSNSSADVATRACLFDDEYVFNADGTFDNVLGADTWLESWQGTDPESCGVPVYPHDSSIDATYTYDAAAGTITLDGKGAFLGLAKVTNTTELSSPGDAPDSVTYLAELSADGNTLEIDIDFGGGWWSFRLVRK